MSLAQSEGLSISRSVADAIAVTRLHALRGVPDGESAALWEAVGYADWAAGNAGNTARWSSLPAVLVARVEQYHGLVPPPEHAAGASRSFPTFLQARLFMVATMGWRMTTPAEEDGWRNALGAPPAPSVAASSRTEETARATATAAAATAAAPVPPPSAPVQWPTGLPAPAGAGPIPLGGSGTAGQVRLIVEGPTHLDPSLPYALLKAFVQSAGKRRRRRRREREDSQSESSGSSAEGEQVGRVLHFTRELTASERLLLPVLDTPLHLLFGALVQPYLSREHYARVHPLGSWSQQVRDKHLKNFRRLARGERSGGVSEDMTCQWVFPPSWSWSIRFNNLGPDFELVEASLHWGRFIGDGYRWHSGAADDAPQAIWRALVDSQWASAEIELANDDVEVSASVLGVFSSAVIQGYRSRMESAAAELSRIPQAFESMRQQCQELPLFMAMITMRITERRAALCSNLLESVTTLVATNRRMASITNTVWGNVYRPFFTRNPAPPRHSSSGGAAGAPPAHGGGGGGGAAWGMLLPSVPPPPYALPPPSFPPPQQERSPMQWQPSPSATRGGGARSTGAPAPSLELCARPVSAAVVGKRLSKASFGLAQVCNICGQRSGSLGNHRHFECPLLYARTFGQPCPGFTMAGQRDPTAWNGDDIKLETEQGWASYIEANRLAPSRIEDRVGSIVFAAVQSGGGGGGPSARRPRGGR